MGVSPFQGTKSCVMLLRALLAPAAVVVGMKHAIRAATPVPGGAGVSSGRQRSWIQIPRSTSTSNPGRPAEEALPDEDVRIRILSYNVLGPRHGMTKKHGHCPLTLRRWTRRSERLREEIREYHHSKPGGLHAVCLQWLNTADDNEGHKRSGCAIKLCAFLQEITPKTLRDTWAPFMKELGLDRHVYQPKDPFPKRLYSHRCLGVAIFYNTQHLEKTAEMRVFFPDHVQSLRLHNNTKRKHSDVLDAAENVSNAAGKTSDTHDAVGKNTKEVQPKREAAPDRGLPERGGGGEHGTRGGGDSQMDVSGAPSRLEQDLSCRPDAAVMVRLRVKGKEKKADAHGGGADGCERQEEEERSLTLVCAHLWFDPFRPDLKTAQCKMLFDAIERFHKKCGVISTGSNETGVEAGGAARGKIAASGPANLILCGDFNSVPVMNPVFLPEPLKTEAQTRLAADGTPRAPSLVNPGNSSVSRIYPPTQRTASGVYSLLRYGVVPPFHPEHPDAFIPYLIRREADAFGSGASTKTQLQGVNSPAVPVLHRPSGGWSSGFGRTLEDAYRDRGAAAPRFTTKTSQFSGVIDHIFVSSGEKDGDLEITGVLAFPPGADLADSPDLVSDSADFAASEAGTGVDGNTAVVRGQLDGVKDERKEREEQEAGQIERISRGDFGPIPDEVWGSDHLALGVELAIL